MRVYLDNCCYNRPYDDMSNLSVELEAQAKLHIQDMIRSGEIELATSYMLEYENDKNPYEMRKSTIAGFVNKYEAIFVSTNVESKVNELAREIVNTGIKYKDACHVASAIISECDYFISTDIRLLKYKTDKIKLINPIDYIREMEGV